MNKAIFLTLLLLTSVTVTGRVSAQNRDSDAVTPLAPAEATATVETPPQGEMAKDDSDTPDATEPTEPEQDHSTREQDETALKQIEAKLDKEPPLEFLIHAALGQADADIDSAKSWQRRVRRSALLPTFKASMGIDLEHDESLDRTQEDPDRWGADTDRDLGLQLTAQWDLSKLVFHPDELRVYNALADRAERRESVSTMLIAYWFERRQLQIMLAVRPPENIEERIAQTLRMKELSARIDTLTGGALTRKYISLVD